MGNGPVKEYASTVQYVHDLQAAEEAARYSELFIATYGSGAPPLARRVRARSDLVTLAYRHDTLSPNQWQALGGFRLRQFVLWEWYDAERVRADGLTVDPAFAELPPDSLHIVVGTSDGRFLAYSCVQSAGGVPEEAHLRLTSPNRSLFPTERELCGPDLFASLPAMRDLPLSRIREWTCSFRRYGANSSLAMAALFAAFCAPLRALADSRWGADAMIGNMNATARKIYVSLGMPVLYAPEAPVVAPADDGYWLPKVNAPGQYWPGALARADLVEHLGVLQRIDEALEAPPNDLRSALALAFHRGPPPPARALRKGAEASPVRWISDLSATRPTRHNGRNLTTVRPKTAS
jgi:hypothetical protein